MTANEICKILEIDFEKMRSKSRKKELVTARQIIVKYFKENKKDYSWERIGTIIDRDHSTALYSYSKLNNLLEIKDKKAIFEWNKIEQNISFIIDYQI